MKSAWLFVLLWLAGTGQAQERLISVDAQDLPVRIALQLVALEAGVSIATADSVVGTVTLKLDRIPWRDALTVIARSKGLVVREQNDVLWVGPGPLSDDGDVPLETVTIPIRFHSAAQIAKAITDAKGLASATAATAATYEVVEVTAPTAVECGDCGDSARGYGGKSAHMESPQPTVAL